MTPAISIQNVRKSFNDFEALKGIDLQVEQGEFFGLLGPNGAGKTTLISLLAGLSRATQGKLHVMGHDVVDDYRQARMKLGVVPQELVFDPFFTVKECLQIQSGYYGIKNNDKWINELLENLGLTDKANVNTRKLSGGMKRRVLVAQALVHKPPVIVLDEPTAGVDVELRQTLWAFIRRLNEQDGHTVILTTHYLEEAETLCSRIAMLKQGQVVKLDTKENLLNNSHHQFVKIQLDKHQLPEVLKPLLIEETSNEFKLKLNDVNELPNILNEIKSSDLTIKHFELTKPDLEDIFIDIMSKSQSPR